MTVVNKELDVTERKGKRYYMEYLTVTIHIAQYLNVKLIIP